MTVKECKSLLEFLDSGDDMVLVEVVKDDLKQQSLVDNLKSFTEALCTNEQVITQLVICHRKWFSQLYVDCKKKPDPMLSFQLCWHKQCSSFLLSEEHKELPGCDISGTRDGWLHYCATRKVCFGPNSIAVQSWEVCELEFGHASSKEQPSNDNYIGNYLQSVVRAFNDHCQTAVDGGYRDGVMVTMFTIALEEQQYVKCSSCIISKSEAVLMSKEIICLKKLLYYKQ